MTTPINNAAPQVNYFTTQFELKDLLDSYRDITATAINCHHIGTIQTFDTLTQTATVTINYTKTYFQWDSTIGTTKPVQITYPVLMICPVICLGGSSTALTFPIETGDECLILFNDRSLDNWYQSGQVGPINSPRLHSISDGIILVGLRNSQKVLANYNTTHAVIRNNRGAQVGVNASTATVLVGNATTTLNTVLQNLTTALNTFATGLNPGNLAAQAAALVTALTTPVTGISSQLGSLLE